MGDMLFLWFIIAAISATLYQVILCHFAILRLRDIRCPEHMRLLWALFILMLPIAGAVSFLMLHPRPTESTVPTVPCTACGQANQPANDTCITCGGDLHPVGAGS